VQIGGVLIVVFAHRNGLEKRPSTEIWIIAKSVIGVRIQANFDAGIIGPLGGIDMGI
jgi:hypothetical protein